jgi:hypothetical protein
MSSSSSSPVKQQAFLITSRNFPIDIVELEPELNKMYIEIARAVNQRTIGTYDTDQYNSGNFYFSLDRNNTQRRRQSYRQAYAIGAIATGATFAFAHNISNFNQLAQAYGTCITDAPDFRPIPFASATAVTAQIQLTVTTSQIIIINGATAPNITSGMIILEYFLT